MGSFVRTQLQDPATARRVRAIYKPRVYGDADGWHRTPMEFVAYRLNLLLGLDLVPPTAYRCGWEGARRRGVRPAWCAVAAHGLHTGADQLREPWEGGSVSGRALGAAHRLQVCDRGRGGSRGERHGVESVCSAQPLRRRALPAASLTATCTAACRLLRGAHSHLRSSLPPAARRSQPLAQQPAAGRSPRLTCCAAHAARRSAPLTLSLGGEEDELCFQEGAMMLWVEVRLSEVG